MTTTRYAAYLADTDQARRIHHYLRYLVYCERKHFEAPTFRAGVAQERDSIDPFSTPFIVHDNHHGKWRASARLIASTRTVLPVQRVGALDEAASQDLFRLPAAEVSRLAVLEGQHGWSEDSRNLIQITILSLLDYSARHGIANLIFLISPALARVLQKIGIKMRGCGPTVQHRGCRRAFSSDVDESLRTLPWANDRPTGHDLCYRRYSEFLRDSKIRWAPAATGGGPTGGGRSAVA